MVQLHNFNYQHFVFDVKEQRRLCYHHQPKYIDKILFFPTHTEPTIRKNGRVEEDLSIDTTRWNISSIPTNISGPLRQQNPMTITTQYRHIEYV